MENSKTSGQPIATSRSLRQVVRQHPLLFFFVMAYAFSWVFFIPLVLSFWGTLPGDSTFRLVMHTLGIYGPTFAALIMTSIAEGKAGMLSLRQRGNQRRAGWQWYLFVLLGIPALFLLGTIIQPGVLASFQGFTPALLASYPAYFIIVFFGGGGIGEEYGWRGFALPRMQPRYGPLRGTLLLGVLWVFWHLPLFLTPEKGGGPGTNIGTYLTDSGTFFLMVMAIAIIFTWVFNHTRGSIFIASLLHASVDTPEVVWIPLFLAVDVTKMNLAFLIAFGVPAVLIVILTRGQLGYPPIPTILEPGDTGLKANL